MARRRFVVLAEGRFGPLTSKTANACLRYIPEQVVAVIDARVAGQTAQEILGFGGAVPVVDSFAAGMRYAPNALLIGIAPQGGQFDPAWRPVVVEALRSGLDVWSGLHALLGDDVDLAALARASGARIHDLRRAPNDLRIGSGRVRTHPATRVLTVGTDSNIGKMTAQLQLQTELRASGLRAQFAATGQTGILLEGRGIAVDAVIADFIAGAAESLTLEAAEGADIVLVEGQGSLLHPAYSGVTLGLMHGALPHGMVLCTQPTRSTIHHQAWVPFPSLPEVIALYEQAMRWLQPSPVIALALNTHDLEDAAAREAVAYAAAVTGLPATDPVRFGAAPIAAAVEALHAQRMTRTTN